MGWWPAQENGRVDWDRKVASNKTRCVNAVPGRDQDAGPICGDWPADILDKALNDVAKAYLHDWGRLPTHEELLRCWRFVTNPIAEGTQAWDAKKQQYRPAEEKKTRRKTSAKPKAKAHK